jgi:hypothetical protein
MFDETVCVLYTTARITGGFTSELHPQKTLAHLVGFEPTTNRLTADCSTTELQVIIYKLYIESIIFLASVPVMLLFNIILLINIALLLGVSPSKLSVAITIFSLKSTLFLFTSK